MTKYYRRYGVREIDIFDYGFTVDRVRTIAICRQIRQRKLDILWACRYVDLGEKGEAVRWYGKAIEINPWHLAAYNNLGKVYSDIGEYEEAIDLYEKAVKVNPR